MKRECAKSTKGAPQSRRSVTGKGADLEKRGRGEREATKGQGTTKVWKRRAWTKRKVRAREGVVSEEGIRVIVRAYWQWLWEAYRRRDLSLEDVAAEIDATRQGFTKLLRRPRGRLFFDTFLRTTFVLREVETGFTIVVDGWKYQLRWTITRCNCGCVSSPDGRA